MQGNGFLELVRQAQGGDRQASDRLFALARPYLEQLARAQRDAGAAPEDDSDLVQAASLRAWQRLGQFQGADDDEQALAKFRGWLGQIVHGLAVNRARDRNRQCRKPPGPVVSLDGVPAGDSADANGPVDPAASELTPAAHLAAEEEARLVRDAIERIADETARAIVRHRFMDGMPLGEIAAVLGISYDKVRERFHAALRTLERELGELL